MVLLIVIQSAKRRPDVDALILSDGITKEVGRGFAVLFEKVVGSLHLLFQSLADGIRRGPLSNGEVGENRNRKRRQGAESLHHITFLGQRCSQFYTSRGE